MYFFLLFQIINIPNISIQLPYQIRVKKRGLFLFSLLFFTVGGLFAQITEVVLPTTADSFTIKKKNSLKLALDLDKRFSFINNSGVNIWGYRIGVSVKNEYKVGIGGYFLKQESSGIILDASGIPINQLTKNLYYGTVYYEPYIFRRKLWEMSMVFELGYGNAELDSSNKIRGRFLTKTEKQDFVSAGMGYSINLILPDIKGLHFLSYFSITSILGLRKTVFNSDLQYNYDGWYWSAGLKIFIDKIFIDLTRKKKRIALTH